MGLTTEAQDYAIIGFVSSVALSEMVSGQHLLVNRGCSPQLCVSHKRNNKMVTQTHMAGNKNALRPGGRNKGVLKGGQTV